MAAKRAKITNIKTLATAYAKGETLARSQPRLSLPLSASARSSAL